MAHLNKSGLKSTVNFALRPRGRTMPGGCAKDFSRYKNLLLLKK